MKEDMKHTIEMLKIRMREIEEKFRDLQARVESTQKKLNYLHGKLK